jgi:hypothetical protein
MKINHQKNKARDHYPTLETPQIDASVERDETARITRRSERSMKIKSGVKAGLARAVSVCD